MPGVGVLGGTLQANKSDIKPFKHIVQMSGFATKRMYDYVHKFACTKEKEEFIWKNTDQKSKHD